MSVIKVMVAEDQRFVREAIINAIKSADDKIKIIGEAENGKVLIELVTKNIPDIILLDLNMPVMSGQLTLAILKEQYPTVKTIIFSSDYSEYLASELIKRGASAYLHKNTEPSKIVEIVRKVFAEGFYFSKTISRNILSGERRDKYPYFMEGREFTEREIEVFRELCKDISDEERAKNLQISIRTVRWYRDSLLEKTESESIISLIKYAIKQGIIEDGKTQ